MSNRSWMYGTTNSTHVTWSLNCIPSCRRCAHPNSVTRKLGCFKSGTNNSHSQRIENRPKLSKTGYGIEIHFNGTCSDEYTHKYFTNNLMECEDLFSFQKKFPNEIQPGRSLRTFYNRKDDVVEFLYYRSVNCRGDVLKHDKFKTGLCYRRSDTHFKKYFVDK